MNGYQRRGASGIDGNGGTFQIQVIGYPCRGDGGVVACDRSIQNSVLPKEKAVFGIRDSEIYTTLLVPQGIAGITGILESFVALLQEQTVVRVYIFGFLGRDSEEQRIEAVDLVQCPEPPGIGFVSP